MSEAFIENDFIVFLVGLALSALCAAATWAMTALGKKLKAQGENTIKGMLLNHVAALAESVVHRLGATLVAKYKAAAADGTISTAERNEIALAALAELKAALTQDGVVRLQKVFGWGATEVDAQLQGVLEKKVVEAKVLAAAAKPLTTAPVIAHP